MNNFSTPNEYALLLQRFEKLQQLCDQLQRQNDELESRFLQTVEKVEQDKLLLSNEIDHLAERLANATNVTSYLEHECASNEKMNDLINNYGINHEKKEEDNIPPEPNATSAIMAEQPLSSICIKCRCDLMIQKSDSSQTDINSANSLIDFYSNDYAQKLETTKTVSNISNDQKVVHDI